MQTCMKTHFSLLAGLMVLAALPAQAQLNMLFENNSGLADSNVWVSIQGASTLATYGTNAVTWGSGNTFSDAVNLATLKADGGFQISNASSAAFYVSYGSPLGSLTVAPSPVATNDPSYNTPYQNFELTRTGSSNDYGDLTYINWYSANLGITTYNGGTNGTLLQSAGFGANSTATVFNALSAITSGNSTAVLTNTNGQYTRVVGPVSYGATSTGPYPSFAPYFNYLSSNNVTTTFANTSGFLVSNNAATNYLFTFNLSSTVNSNGVITATGTVTQTQTAGGTNNAVYSNVTIQYGNTTNVGNAAQVTTALYSANIAAQSNTITFSGTNWTTLSNAMVTIYGTSTNPAYTTGSNAYYTVTSQMVGEISAGFEAGLVGSTNLVQAPGSTNLVPLGTLASSNWWAMTNPPLFSAAQTNTNFYDPFGNVIYTNTSNSVYGFSYSDRFVQTPAIYSDQYQGTNVNTWLVNVGQSVEVVPEPSSGILVFAGLMVAAILIAARRKGLGILKNRD